MQKKKVLKIIFKVIFILSFIPLAYMLIYSTYSAFAGYTPTNFIGQVLDTIYGFEAFEYVFFGCSSVCAIQ